MEKGNFLCVLALAVCFIALSGCVKNLGGNTGLKETPVTTGSACDKPYILVGRECCFDGNDNRICDRDEQEDTAETTLAPEPDETTTSSTATPTSSSTTLKATTTTYSSTTTVAAQTVKHKACVADKYGIKKCTLVEGASSNECTDDFSCMKLANGICVDGACVEGGIGNDSCEFDRDCYHFACIGSSCVRMNYTGENECLGTTDQTCWVKDQLREYHYECSTGVCTKVDGSGSNECEPGSDTKCRHKVCQADKCIEILTPGASNCVDDQTCAPTHGVCQAGACVQAPGIGRDECTRDSQC